MNTCKNCQYWKGENSDFGDCEKVFEEHGFQEEETPTNTIIFGVGGHYDSVTTGKDFGCIHFKQK